MFIRIRSDVIVGLRQASTHQLYDNQPPPLSLESDQRLAVIRLFSAVFTREREFWGMMIEQRDCNDFVKIMFHTVGC